MIICTRLDSHSLEIVVTLHRKETKQERQKIDL